MSTRLSRALLISLLVTIALTALFSFILGPYAFGLFLFLPLTFAFGRPRSTRPTEPPDNKPIEPR